MKVAHIVSTYPPYRGGMGNVAFQMVQELQKRDHDVHVFTPAQSEKQMIDPQHGIHRLKPYFAFRNSAYLPQLYGQLHDFDVLHLHYPFFGGAEAVARFKKKHPQIPLIITYHMDVEGQGAVRTFFQLYKKIYFPRIMAQADQILVSSLDYAKTSPYLEQIEQKKIREFPFGIPEEFKSSTKKSQADNVQLLFVATLDKSHYFKGLHLLLQSIRRSICTECIDLTVIGDGDMRPEYEQMVKDLQIEDRVRFLGKVSDKELIQAYQKADITMFPSTDRSEAFGLVQAESMACGTPVIASALPGVRTLVKSCQGGLLVSPGSRTELTEAMDDLIAHADKRLAMGKNASKCIEEQYRWPYLIDQLEAIYRDPRSV